MFAMNAERCLGMAAAVVWAAAASALHRPTRDARVT